MVSNKNKGNKGYDKCSEFDKMALGYGWEKLAGEHRYFTGPIPRVCNVAGFDRLYASPGGPILVEVCAAGDQSIHRQTILDRLHDHPLINQNFRVILVKYYGGNPRLDKHKAEKTWTKAGTWEMEEINRKETPA